MGLAVIVSNYGESYYRIRLLYDFTSLDREITQLQQQKTDYYKKNVFGATRFNPCAE